MKHYNWLTQNSKMKKSTGLKVYNWGIPAYRAADGFKTCPNAAACAKGCYALSGAYLFSNVAKVFEARLRLSQSAAFVETLDAEIKRRGVLKLRIHDSGDFYSAQYLAKWTRIMKRNPQTEFYAYTKMVSMLKNASSTLPSNFRLIYSYGGTEDKLIDQATDRHSLVFEAIEALLAAGYADASNDDTVALGENPRIGLVYHGAKSFQNTYWARVGLSTTLNK